MSIVESKLFSGSPQVLVALLYLRGLQKILPSQEFQIAILWDPRSSGERWKANRVTLHRTPVVKLELGVVTEPF